MDTQHIPPVFASPPVQAGRLAGALTGTPLIERSPLVLPHKPEASREGRFFEIRILPSGVWRCLLKTVTDGTVSFRDFGYSDEDYLRAWEFGNEWANS